MEANVFNIVSLSCIDDQITLPYLTVHRNHKLSSIEKPIKRTKNKLKDLS
jgi:hypothetical protein